MEVRIQKIILTLFQNLSPL